MWEGAGGGQRLMSFELEADEALPVGIQRIAEKELELIRELLGAHTKYSRDDAVYESRRGRSRRPAQAVTPGRLRRTARRRAAMQGLDPSAPVLARRRDPGLQPGLETTAMPSTVAFYLSEDDVLDEDDVTTLELGGEELVRLNLRLPEGIDAAGLVVICVADFFNDAAEQNETNNEAVSPPGLLTPGGLGSAEQSAFPFLTRGHGAPRGPALIERRSGTATAPEVPRIPHVPRADARGLPSSPRE